MFITSHDGSKTLRAQVYKPGMRLPVFQASALLANKQHQFYLAQLRDLSLLSAEQHQSTYEAFIEEFAAFVQVFADATHRSLGVPY